MLEHHGIEWGGSHSLKKDERTRMRRWIIVSMEFAPKAEHLPMLLLELHSWEMLAIMSVLLPSHPATEISARSVKKTKCQILLISDLAMITSMQTPNLSMPWRKWQWNRADTLKDIWIDEWTVTFGIFTLWALDRGHEILFNFGQQWNTIFQIDLKWNILAMEGGKTQFALSNWKPTLAKMKKIWICQYCLCRFKVCHWKKCIDELHLYKYQHAWVKWQVLQYQSQ